MSGDHSTSGSPDFFCTDSPDSPELGLKDRGPLVHFNTMVRFQGSLLGLALLLGYCLGFLPAVSGGADGMPRTGDAAAEPLRSLNWLGNGWAWALVMGGGVALLLVMIVRWMERQRWAWLSKIERVVEQVLVPSLQACSIWQLASLAALAGVGEELLFRWALQGGFEMGLRWVGIGRALDPAGWLSGHDIDFWLAAIVSASIFGLCHAVTRAYWVLAAVLGLLFSLLVVAGGGLVAAILAHGLYDFLVFLMLCRAAETPRPSL
jgi:hypothetical protein